MDKSIALQKKVWENSQSLQNEFLDLKNWEADAKKSDKKIKDVESGQNKQLPPIRKKKTPTTTPKRKENQSQSKRIKSHDYSSWDKFDAEKACEEIEIQNETIESYEEIITEAELEKNHEEASKHKILGNKYVKEQKWDKAMSCYSEAIKLFSYDAVFFANRALCHLKMDNCYSTVADCTTAIQLDGNYVKAYHRRATARMELKQYAEAVDDLKQILSIEKNNKEAQQMLIIAQKALHKTLNYNIKKNLVNETTKFEVTKTKIETKSLKDIKIKGEEEKPADDFSTMEEITSKKIDFVDKCDARENIILKDWLPFVEDDVDIVKVIDKLPHHRSKKLLRSVPIAAKDLTESATEVKKKITQVLAKANNDSKTEIKKSGKVELKADDEVEAEVPPAPTSSIQFLETWRKYKSSSFRYKYLKQVSPESLPKIFKDCMESDTFSGILDILSSHFVINKDPIFNYIKFLSEIKRFRTLTMFLGATEKKDLIRIFEYCKTSEGQPDEKIQKIRAKYEL